MELLLSKSTSGSPTRLDPGVEAVFDALEFRKARRLYPSNKAELAQCLGIKKQAVSSWDKVPIRRVLDIERVLGIPRIKMRPDVYGGPSYVMRTGKTKVTRVTAPQRRQASR